MVNKIRELNAHNVDFDLFMVIKSMSAGGSDSVNDPIPRSLLLLQ